MNVHRWIVAFASRLVPRSLREEWRAEWHAELAHRESRLREWNRPARGELARRSAGAIWDALWIQSAHWHSLRLFARHWRLTVTALVSLAAAIAAVAVSFDLYRTLLVRAPGVSNPKTLLTVSVRTATNAHGSASFEEFLYYRANNHVFDDLAAFPFSITTMDFEIGSRRESGVAGQMSNNYFTAIGVRPALGVATVADGSDLETASVVLSNKFWKKLGADPRIVGSTVKINNHAVTIIGVTPVTFVRMLYIWEPDVWMPLKTAQAVFGGSQRLFTNRTERWLRMVGRLKAGITEQQAAAEMKVLSSRLEQQYPRTDKGRTAVLDPTTMIPTEDRGWVSLLAGGLLAIGILILVVACANVANLLLGLSTVRRHEMLVRAALGASRRQIMVPVLRESLTLAVVAGAIGYGAARKTLVSLSALKPAFALFPTPSIDLSPDFVVATAIGGVVVIAGLAVGFLPAWRSAAHGLAVALNRELLAAEPNKGRTRRMLVVAQMAIAILVLVAVGVSVQSLTNLEREPLGFSARNLRFIMMFTRQSGYDERTSLPLYDRIRRRVGAIPGVEGASLIDGPPLFNGWGRDYVMAEDEMRATAGRGAETRVSVVDAAYFSTMGIARKAGRTFDSRDRSDSPEVVIINETMARQHWPARDPVGQRLRVENGDRLVRVIGVVDDSKYDEIDEKPLPFMYLSLDQHFLSQVVLAVRLEPSSPMPAATITKVLRELEPTLGVTEFAGSSTFDDVLALHLYLPRLIVKTVSVFGGFTLMLAVVGLYSSVFYSVSQRHGEIGIRIALGAQPRDLFVMVLRDTTWLAVGGAVLGTAAGFALLPLVSSAFYGIRPVEPLVVTVVAGVSVLVALLTAYAATRPLTRMSAVAAMRWHP